LSAKDTVLARIREALADVPSAETAEDVAVPRSYARSHAGPDVVALFAERVADYRARVTRAGSADEARQAVAEALAERGVGRLVVPEGFPGELLPEGAWEVLSDTPPLTVEALDGADAVLTTAARAIAVTGTVVLDAGPGQGRRALTLLPDFHLCVVREEQVAADVPDALALLDPARPLTFISGPSATSDIELDRIEGVHGPRTLHVIIISDLPPTTP